MLQHHTICVSKLCGSDAHYKITRQVWIRYAATFVRKPPEADSNYGNCIRGHPIHQIILRYMVSLRRRGGDRTPASKPSFLNDLA